MPHAPPPGWARVGVGMWGFENLNAPPLGRGLLVKSPYVYTAMIRSPYNAVVKCPTPGFVTKSDQIPTLPRGMQLIGA
jgi:hypothetical protein